MGVVGILSDFAGGNEFASGELLNLTARLHQPYRILEKAKLRIARTDSKPSSMPMPSHPRRNCAGSWWSLYAGRRPADGRREVWHQRRRRGGGIASQLRDSQRSGRAASRWAISPILTRRRPTRRSCSAIATTWCDSGTAARWARIWHGAPDGKGALLQIDQLRRTSGRGSGLGAHRRTVPRGPHPAPGRQSLSAASRTATERSDRIASAGRFRYMLRSS